MVCYCVCWVCRCVVAIGRDANSAEIRGLHSTNDLPSTSHESSYGEGWAHHSISCMLIRCTVHYTPAWYMCVFKVTSTDHFLRLGTGVCGCMERLCAGNSMVSSVPLYCWCWTKNKKMTKVLCASHVCHYISWIYAENYILFLTTIEAEEVYTCFLIFVQSYAAPGLLYSAIVLQHALTLKWSALCVPANLSRAQSITIVLCTCMCEVWSEYGYNIYSPQKEMGVITNPPVESTLQGCILLIDHTVLAIWNIISSSILY